MSEETDPCPVCGAPMPKVDCKDETYALLEAYRECPSGCYSFEFVYGSFRESVGDRTWEWDHATPRDESNGIKDEIRTAIKEARQAFLARSRS